MGSIRLSDTTDKLFLDFRFEGKRCREYTLLPDTPANRKKLQKVLDRIEAEISSGTFVYESYFPNSKALTKIVKARQAKQAALNAGLMPEAVAAVPEPTAVGPSFKEFANQWVDEHSIEWRRSNIKSLLSTLNGRLIVAADRKLTHF